ncbi:MAG: type I 3-dehydroquinate dehydratase [Candidatus Hydrogenedentota bacterium]|nr:MAG: type I 3-dehydroquinate dehydratase [Candidatus Hydrogenedentota bacterium]
MVRRRRIRGTKGKRGRVEWGSRTAAFPVLILFSLSEMLFEEIRRDPPVAVEARLDLVPPREETLFRTKIEILKEDGVAVLVTVRRRRDGGRWCDRDEAGRLEKIMEWLDVADAVDIEWDCARWVRKIRRIRPDMAILLSHHDFSGIVPDYVLKRILRAGRRLDVTRIKIACRTTRVSDVRTLERQAEEIACFLPVTMIGMGKKTVSTRWMFPRLLGGPVYCVWEKPVAPGQIRYEVVRELIS